MDARRAGLVAALTALSRTRFVQEDTTKASKDVAVLGLLSALDSLRKARESLLVLDQGATPPRTSVAAATLELMHSLLENVMVAGTKGSDAEAPLRDVAEVLRAVERDHAEAKPAGNDQAFEFQSSLLVLDFSTQVVVCLQRLLETQALCVPTPAGLIIPP